MDEKPRMQHDLPAWYYRIVGISFLILGWSFVVPLAVVTLIIAFRDPAGWWLSILFVSSGAIIIALARFSLRHAARIEEREQIGTRAP